jgi:methyltransferase (TIGR00027 family)
MTAVRAFHHLAHADWRVLDDEYAVTLLGELAEDLKKAASEAPPPGPFPINTPARHRYAEDRLLELVSDGLDQYVLLGAGLDTSPLRHRLVLDRCRVFELDHPASQAWKLRRFTSAGLTAPENVVFIAADLTVDELDVVLREGGFDPQRPSFVSWLGVTYYLTVDAVVKTLNTIASWAPGTHVVFDYFLPPDTWPPEMHSQAQSYAALGEPWITWWGDSEVERLLSECALDAVELVTTAEVIERYAPDAPIELHRRVGQHIAHAVVS